MSKVILMIGTSGSGKSTYTKSFYPKHTVYSADLFFERQEGGYQKNFDPNKLGEAHKACFQNFVMFCVSQDHLIAELGCVVDNTNTNLIDVAPYIQVATAFGHEVEVVYLQCDPEVAAKRNTHGVPERTVKRMQLNIEYMLKSWPGRWPKVRTIQQ